MWVKVASTNLERFLGWGDAVFTFGSPQALEAQRAAAAAVAPNAPTSCPQFFGKVCGAQTTWQVN